MASYSVSGSLRIAAPPARIYGIIADYHRGHPTILPKQFRNLRVESGSGIGAGTTIRFEVTVMGKTDRYKAIVSEPEPGRVLVEKNLDRAGRAGKAGSSVVTCPTRPTRP